VSSGNLSEVSHTSRTKGDPGETFVSDADATPQKTSHANNSAIAIAQQFFNMLELSGRTPVQ
jgi:hypothetical protein